MPRPTLKLPNKPTHGKAAGDPRALLRKPLRGGSPAAKHATPRRADGPGTSPVTAGGQSATQNNAIPAWRSRAGGAPGRPSEKKRAEIATASTEVANGHGDSTPPQTIKAMTVPSPPTPLPGAGEGRFVSRGRDFHINDQPQLPSGDEATAASPTPQAADNRPRDRLPGGFGDRPPATDRPQRRAKTYPPRGVARSTGARALPPAPPRAAEQDPLPIDATHGQPAVLAPREPPARALRNQAAAVATGQRGPAKEPPRLAKQISELTGCSRREADEWIENGWVSVDGVVIKRLGARVNPKASIEIKEAARQHCSDSVTIVFNRPANRPDAPSDEGRESAVTLIRSANHWTEDSTSLRFKATHLRALAPAGRLDAEAGGMRVFTQEGSVARRLSGGDSRLEKEYHVRVTGELVPDGLELLRHGLTLDAVKLLRAQVSWLSEQQLRFVLHESRPRQIQRMCALVGLQATEIRCVRIGSVSLGKLPPGQWRYLRPDERF